MTGRRSRALGWVGILAATLVVLRLGGGGELAPPPLRSLGALGAWVDEREPATVVIALVRFGAELTVWYLLALTGLHAAAVVFRVRGASALAESLGLPGADRAVRVALGLGLLATTAAGSSGADDTPTTTATMRPTPAQPADDGGTATMAPVAPMPAPDPPAPTPAPAPPSTWTVSPGESFWTIAEELLADAWGRAPTDAEIDPFWRQLVDRNRHRLVEPGNPDLIHPGQVFETPPPPAPG